MTDRDTKKKVHYLLASKWEDELMIRKFQPGEPLSNEPMKRVDISPENLSLCISTSFCLHIKLLTLPIYIQPKNNNINHLAVKFNGKRKKKFQIKPMESPFQGAKFKKLSKASIKKTWQVPTQTRNHSFTQISHINKPGNRSFILRNHMHKLKNRSHVLRNHIHRLRNHSHKLRNHIHKLRNHIHKLKNHIHKLRNHIHKLKNHIHKLKNHIHRLRNHIHILKNHIHKLRNHLHKLRNHIHRLRNHSHKLRNHIHKLWNHIHRLRNGSHPLYNRRHKSGFKAGHPAINNLFTGTKYRCRVSHKIAAKNKLKIKL